MDTSSPPHPLSGDLAAFVEARRGPISSCRRSEGGASRITWLLDTAQGPCVLRVDPGDGPVAHTPLNLAREATVYRALAGTGVRIPRLIDARPDALLVERAEGTEDLDALAEDARARVMDDYVDALAELHLCQVGSSFRALDPPASAAEAATAVVRLWEGILQARVRRPSPLAAVASQWLTRHAPRDAERLTVCHGDVGPGNFLHDGARVTALLDWEFVHVGDPMDDLGWLAFRGHHMRGNIGDFDAQLRRWSQHTGFEVDRRRIAYYRIVVMYIFLVSCLAALDNGARNQNRFVYLNLISMLQVVMPRAMFAFESQPLAEGEAVVAARESELSEQLAALVDLIALKWPAADPGRALVELMARQVLEYARIADAVTGGNLDAVASLLGAGVAAQDADRRFADWIREHPGRDLEALAVIHANGRRRAQSDVVLRFVVDRPLLPL
jgi:aminoglycoside phosphotransferase (APT) family kinase protein